MKLKNEFIVFETEKESMLVPTGASKFAGLMRGNKTLGEILELLKKDTTEEKIVAALYEKYEGSKRDIAADVRKTVNELKRIGALTA